MTAPLYDLRDGQLCGAGCGKPFSYLVSRARKYCRATLVIFGPGERRVFDRLVATYPSGQFWVSRGGCLVEAVCRDVAKYVQNLDNWTDEELRAEQDVAREATREEQRGRYLDSGPGGWDDEGTP